MTPLTKTLPGILLASVLAASAAAQDAPKSYTLTVDQAELALISQALSGQPYSAVAALIARLSAQIEAQARGQASPAVAEGASPPPKSRGEHTR